MHKKVSGWVRQARHRSKAYSVVVRLDVKEIQAVIDELAGICAYCRTCKATTLDNAFPISEGAPNVLANVLPVCQACKVGKGTRDLVALFGDGDMERDRYIALLKEMLERDGSEELKEHIRHITGVGLA